MVGDDPLRGGPRGWSDLGAGRATGAAAPRQFQTLRASELYCPTCRRAMPVRERLLLLLRDGELHEFRCARCGTSLGTRQVREEQASPLLIR